MLALNYVLPSGYYRGRPFREVVRSRHGRLWIEWLSMIGTSVAADHARRLVGEFAGEIKPVPRDDHRPLLDLIERKGVADGR